MSSFTVQPVRAFKNVRKIRWSHGKNNVIGPVNLIKSMKSDVHFVYLSTAQVFDGNAGLYDEDSVRNPINWYGQTKAASEDIVLNISSIYTIVRLATSMDTMLKERILCIRPSKS